MFEIVDERVFLEIRRGRQKKEKDKEKKARKTEKEEKKERERKRKRKQTRGSSGGLVKRPSPEGPGSNHRHTSKTSAQHLSLCECGFVFSLVVGVPFRVPPTPFFFRYQIWK